MPADTCLFWPTCGRIVAESRGGMGQTAAEWGGMGGGDEGGRGGREGGIGWSARAESRQNRGRTRCCPSLARKTRRAAACRAPDDGPRAPLPRPLRATPLPPRGAPAHPLHLDVTHRWDRRRPARVGPIGDPRARRTADRRRGPTCAVAARCGGRPGALPATATTATATAGVGRRLASTTHPLYRNPAAVDARRQRDRAR